MSPVMKKESTTPAPKTVVKPKSAILLCGEPGTGKSQWVRTEAKRKDAQLFRWNIRVDRSLREGREILHQQVRACEPMYVWLEGADDLTQEAQAFLRRILETASPNITCVLEVREPWKLSPPILSRCTIVQMHSKHSFRNQRNLQFAKDLNLIASPQADLGDMSYHNISEWRRQGVDPMELLRRCIDTYGWTDEDIQKCVRGIGSGSSSWTQLALFFYRKNPGSVRENRN